MEMDTDLVLDVDEIEEEGEVITRTYNIDFVNGRIDGMIDGLEAVEQAITKILLTERFKSLIYSDGYGSEVKDTLTYEDNTDAFLATEIPELIRDALSDDERILEVDNFNIQTRYDGIDGTLITFDVSTIYGDTTMEEVI